jgi:hypothetical protein
MRLLLLPALLLLAACDSAATTGGLAPLPGQHATASFPPGSPVNVIRVDVLDNLPLRAAELVAPDGTATPASWLNVNRTLQANGGAYTTSSPWRSEAGLNDVSPSLLPGAPGAAFQSHSELLLMSADADIPLPDAVAYRRDWQQYRIRLTYGAPDGPQVHEIPAPEPPPLPSHPSAADASDSVPR